MLMLEVAAVGAGMGLALAAREVAQQHYLAQGLWRTALWVTGSASIGAGLLAIAAGLALLGVLSLSRLTIARGGDPTPAEWGRRYLLFLLSATGIGVLLSPQSSGHGVGIPYRALLAIDYGTVLLALAAASLILLSRSPDSGCEAWFRARWLSVVGIGFAVSFLHLWTRGFKPIYLVGFSAVALVVWLAAFFGLIKLARSVDYRLGVPIAGLLSGLVGRVLTLLVLALALAAGIAGTLAASRASAGAKARARNVIVIGVDTLRADRMSLLSPTEHARDLSPNVRRLLAARGRVFTNAIAQSSWTLPSFASMFTGLYPEQHGAEQLTSTLAPSQLTLAELLRDAGYHTMSVVSCEYLNRASGLGQGFDLLDESQVLGHQAVTSEQITDRSIKLLESNGDRPFFLFAHYFDPHFCYRAHNEYPFGDWYQGWLKNAVQTMDQNAFCWAIGAIGPAYAMRSRATPDDRRFLSDMYDGEVAYTEAQIGRLLDYIDRKKLWDSTMVIFVGDHGEELLERNWSGHSTTLYQEQIHVPLVVSAPGVAPSVEPRVVEPRSIFPTVLEFLGLQRVPRSAAAPADPLPFGGEDTGTRPRPTLVRSSTRPVATPPRRGEIVPKYVWLTCVTDGRWKLISDHLNARATLFDLSHDPGETADCSTAKPDRRREFEKALIETDAAVSGTAPGRRTEATEEQQRRLKSLGYL